MLNSLFCCNMTEVFKVGDFGRFHFTVKRKGRIFGHDLYATVEEIDISSVLLRDNDGFIHIPKLKDVDLFEAAELNTQENN